MRELLIKETQLEWDEPIPEVYKRRRTKLIEDLTEMNYFKNKRSGKADNSGEDPLLLIFSEGSTDAYVICAYVCWRLRNGKYDS